MIKLFLLKYTNLVFKYILNENSSKQTNPLSGKFREGFVELIVF
jgi:hypothetical protein